MRRLGTAVLVLFTACSGKDAALKLVVTTVSERPDTCFAVKVNSADDEVLSSAELPREADDAQFELAIYQGSNFPDDVSLRVEAWVGADGGCDEPRVANGVLTTPAHFSKGVTTVEAKLETLADVDLDHAVASSAGGVDCDDGDALRSPFFTENCGQPADRDCDGNARCTDSDCAEECHGIATSLVFTNAPLTVGQGACGGALQLGARDFFGLPAPLPGGLTLTGEDVSFFSGFSCSGAVPGSIPNEGLTVYVRGARAGTVLLTAAAPGVSSATQSLEVLSAPSLELLSASSTIAATACVTQGLQLRSVDGGLFISPEPIEVSVNAGASRLDVFDGCANPQPRATITLTGVSSTTFGFSTPRAGPITLTASAPGFLPASVAYTVVGGPAYSITLDAGTLNAAACNPIAVSWADDAGNPTTPGGIQVSSGFPLFSDPACTTVASSLPGAAGTFYAAPADQGDAPLSVDGGTVSGQYTLHAVRPFPPGAQLEIPITVHTGGNAPFNGYAGYSTLVILDAGAPLPDDLSLLRTYFWSPGGWAEIDRVYGPVGTTQWQFWFRSQTDLADDFTDDRYAFFVMTASSPPAKTQGRNVWLFVDDFEDGLSNWTDGGSQFAFDNTSGHSGTTSLLNTGNDAGVELTINLATPLNEKDLAFQSFWKSPNLAGVNFAQQLRVQPPSNGVTWVAHEVNKASSGWRFATYSDATTYSREGGSDVNSGTASMTDANGWALVLVQMFRGDIAGQMPAGTETRHIGSPLGAGSIGFRSSGVTHAPVSIDDIIVRRLAVPEPVTTVLPSRTSP